MKLHSNQRSSEEFLCGKHLMGGMIGILGFSLKTQAK
jgi:hypothetical protein